MGANELATLRMDIDRLDLTIHQSLMARAKVIDRLVEIKKSDATGSAFRPLREAQMLEMLVKRHSGSLPLSFTVCLWRQIMSTFTYLQSPFHVHLLQSAREAAREFYGFEVEFISHGSNESVLEALKNNEKDLGYILIDGWKATLPPHLQIIAAWKNAVIIGSSKIETDGLTHMALNNAGKLSFIPRDTSIDKATILGYCTPFTGDNHASAA